MKTFYQSDKADLIDRHLEWIWKIWKTFSIRETEKYNYRMVETLGKSNATQKIKCTLYRHVHVIDIAWMYFLFKNFKETITLYFDVRPDVQRRCLHAHDTYPPPLILVCILHSKNRSQEKCVCTNANCCKCALFWNN